MSTAETLDPDSRQAPDTRLHQSQASQRLVRVGLVAALVSRVFTRLVGFILVIALAHRADPTTVAVYGYLLGTATLVIGLTSVGVANIAGREVAASRIPVAEALRAALGPHVTSLVAAALLTVVVTLALGPDGVPPSALALTVGFVLAGGLNGLYAELLRASGRVVLEGALQMAGAVSLVLAGTFVVLHGTPLDTATALLAMVLAKELALLVVGMALLRPKRGATAGRDLLRQSVWLAVSSTAMVGLWRQGMLVIGAVGHVRSLATYVVATRYQDAGVSLAFTVGFGLRPGFSALADDPAAFRRTVRHYLALAAAVGVAIAIVGVLAGHALVDVPFGPRWPDAVTPVRVIAVAGLPILVSFVALSALVARGALRYVAAGAVAGAVSGTAVSLALAHWYATALSPTVGTTAGATVIALVYLAGLRDLLRSRRSTPADMGTWGPRPVPWSGVAARVRASTSARRLIPTELALLGTDLCYRLLLRLRPGRAAAARESLAAVVGGTSRAADIERLAPRHVAALARGWELTWRPWELARIPVRGRDELDAARATGRGLIISHSHVGPLAARFPLMRMLRPLLVPQGDWVLDEPRPGYNGYQVEQWRRLYQDAGVEMLHHVGSAPRVHRTLRRGGAVLISMDVPGSRRTEFLGKPVDLDDGTAQMADRTGALILPMTLVPVGRRWEIEIQPALDPHDFDGPDELHLALARLHEDLIMRAPEHLESPARLWASATAQGWHTV